MGTMGTFSWNKGIDGVLYRNLAQDLKIDSNVEGSMSKPLCNDKGHGHG